MSTVMIREPEPRERIMQMIHEVLDDVALAKDAEESIESIVEKGFRRVESDRLDQARSLEAQDNFRAFATALKQHAIENQLTTIEGSDVTMVLRSLCPIYPIC